LDVEVTFPAGTIEVAGLSLAPVPSPLAEHEEGVEANEGILPTRFDTVRVEVSVESGFSPPQRLSLTPPDYHDVDISYAERVLAVGAGAATRELLPQIERLADLLRASLATTRPVVDDGLLPKERMVGQTGRSVAPDLYLAFGISGSPHHVAGFQEAGTVLTLNSDVRAPILQFSDMSYLGRAEEIIPLLVARLEEWREGEGS
jgi:electron transfer flavoprotein alpha subunit